MDVCSVIDDFNEMVAAFRAIRNRYPNDPETTAFINKGLFAGAEAIGKLYMMVNYKDPETGTEEVIETNGNAHSDNGRAGDIARE